MDPNIAEHVQNLSNLEWITHGRNNQSVIDGLFTFQCMELQMCSQCSLTSANIQTMSILSLPVPDQDELVSLDSCTKTLIARERLFGRDGLQCRKCQAAASENQGAAAQTPALHHRKTVTRAMSDITTPVSPIQHEPYSAGGIGAFQKTPFLSSTPLPGSGKEKLSAPVLTTTIAPPPTKVITEGIRQCLLRRLPKCLIIQLLRFNYDTTSKKVRKIHTPVSLPLQSFDLTPVTYDSVVDRDDMTGISKHNLYSLYAVCLHIGGNNTNSGHYLAYCKAANGLWYKFDDEAVLEVKDIEMDLQKPQVSENCYLLFYRKQHEGS